MAGYSLSACLDWPQLACQSFTMGAWFIWDSHMFSLSVYLPFLSLCPFTAVSPQREQLVPPAVTHVAGQTSSHCLHPPAPLPERWCWLAARTAAAFCAVTASCHQRCSHLPQSLLPTPWSSPPTLDAQVDGSLEIGRASCRERVSSPV